MYSEQMSAALGQPYESPAVQVLVRELGLTKAPKPKKDDPNVYLAAKSMGIELMFVDNDYLERKQVARYGNAPMICVGATLYTGHQTGDPSMRRYGGDLPGGATFDDSVETLIAKLGPPTGVFEDDDVVVTRVWARGTCKVGFNYDDAGTLQYVALSWDVYMKLMSEE